MLKFKKGTVIHCKTEELANKVLKIAHEQGYKWCTGISYIDTNYYERYEKDTCYRIVDGEYSPRSYYESIGERIITAEEFLEEPQIISINSIKDKHPELAALMEKRSKAYWGKDWEDKDIYNLRITALFIWENTPEGHDFWLSIRSCDFSVFYKTKTTQTKAIQMKTTKYFTTKTINVGSLERDITIAVFCDGVNLFGGYAVRNPIDVLPTNLDELANFVSKRKTIAEGRAFNPKTNMLKGKTVGSLNERYILKAIADNLLREIETGKIIIKGIR